MGNIFSGSEVVELGIQIEKNGRDFYNALVKKTKDLGAQQTFQHLAKEEEKHIDVFKKMLTSLIQYEPPESYPGEYIAYMGALASEHVFTKANKGEEVANNAKGDLQAVDLGIGFEKDSIIFYEGMKKVVPENEISIVNQLIAQEQEHLRKLSELKKSL